MNIYTVSFFGHREIEGISEIETKLENLLHELIVKKEYVEFLIGRDGEFDVLVAASIRRVVRKYGSGNTSLILFLPYMKAEYRDNEQNYLNYYDEVEICDESSIVHYKSAIQVRNRSMVDRSNLVVCCIQHQSGGAYQTMKYAHKRNRCVVNLTKSDLSPNRTLPIHAICY